MNKSALTAPNPVCAPRLVSRKCPTSPQRQQFMSADRLASVIPNAMYESSLRVGKLQVTSPKAWGIIADKLRASQVNLIAQQQVGFYKEKGAVLVDIRPYGEYEVGHISDSVNVPLYRLIEGWTPMKALRRAGFAFFGVFNGTEVNPFFNEEISAIESLSNKDTPIVLVCQYGGSLEPSVNLAHGKQSRALIAAYELLKLGFTNISVVKGGFAAWKKNERPYDVLDSANES